MIKLLFILILFAFFVFTITALKYPIDWFFDAPFSFIKKFYGFFLKVKSLVTGILAAYLSVYIAELLLLIFNYRISNELQISSIITIIYFTVIFIYAIASNVYYYNADHEVDTVISKSNKTRFKRVIELESLNKQTHALSVIGVIIGFSYSLDYWSIIESWSLVSKVLSIYLFIGIMSAIDDLGRFKLMPNSIFGQFIKSILFWSFIRVFMFVLYINEVFYTHYKFK